MSTSYFSGFTANERGILAFVVSCAFFSANDTIMKFIIVSYPIGEAIFARGLLAVLILAVAIGFLEQPSGLRQIVRPIILLRAGLDALTSAGAVVALFGLGVAELSAIAQTSPLVLTAMAAIFYKEQVRWRRWLAIFVGFSGTLFIIKPDGGSINAWALIALCVVCVACNARPDNASDLPYNSGSRHIVARFGRACGDRSRICAVGNVGISFRASLLAYFAGGHLSCLRDLFPRARLSWRYGLRRVAVSLHDAAVVGPRRIFGLS